MPRVTHVKSARKDNPVCKQGEAYYHWKFRFGGKHYSLTYPKASQLTQSNYYSTLHGLAEALEQESPPDNESDFDTMRDDLASSIQELAEECQGNLDNMPDSLQQAPTGELLQERIDACESAVNDLESLTAPEEWQEIIDLQNDYEEWENNEPSLNDFEDDNPDEVEDGETAEDKFIEATEIWEAKEPDAVEDVEPFEVSEFIETLDQCHV